MAGKKGSIASIYQKALSYFSEYKDGMSLAEMRRAWQKTRNDLVTQGIEAPTVYEAAKGYDEMQELWDNQDVEPPTIDFAGDTIEQFLANVDNIYHSTLNFIREHEHDGKNFKDYETGKLAGIAKRHEEELGESWQQIHSLILELQSTGVPDSIIAKAIAENVELEYVVAVELQPPSDLVILFDQTIEQLKGVAVQIEKEAQRLAEEMENEYYGQ